MMKKILSLIVFSLIFLPLVALAQELPPDVVTPPAGLEWLGPVIVFLKSIPYVGPFVVFVLKWVGAVAAIATALSLAVQAILVVPEVVARWSGAPELAAKIKAIQDKVLPILKYISIFNVQKKLK